MLRIFMILTAIPFLLPHIPFDAALAARACALLIISVALAVSATDVQRLSVRSPGRFIAGNYLFYNGTLLALAAIVGAGEGLRLWYLAVQLGLVGVLKVLDYSLRRASALDRRLEAAVLIVAACLPVIAFVLHPNFGAAALFTVGFSGLISLKRYIKE